MDKISETIEVKAEITQVQPESYRMERESTRIVTIPKERKYRRKPRNRGFKPVEAEEYSMRYKRNESTGRMRKVWSCKGPGCSKVFHRICSLKDHLRLHRADKPFACSICGKSWAQKGNRDRHVAKGLCLGGIEASFDEESVAEQVQLVRDMRAKKKSGPLKSATDSLRTQAEEGEKDKKGKRDKNKSASL